jgi:hypothetical protein
MKLIGIMPVRNEAWCIGLSARAALMWCDELLIIDHASTDETPAICSYLRQENGARVGHFRINDPTWEEMQHRQLLLEGARLRNATHIAMIDADEVLTGNMLSHIRGIFEQLPQGKVLTLPWLCLRNGIGDVMTSGLWGQATVSTGFVDDPVCHWAAQGREKYDFHHRHPMGRPFEPYLPAIPPVEGIPFGRGGGLMHLQFCSRRRLLAKQALYQAIEVIRWPGRKSAPEIADYYGRTVYESDVAATRPVPESWWRPYGPLLQHLDVEAEPWQEAELRRLVAEHGRAKFEGLDFFGVA